MPRARFLFLFDDKTLFRDLLPLPDELGRHRSRRDIVNDANFDFFKEWIRREQERAKRENRKIVTLPQDYLAAVHAQVPERLRYLFLSGFIQNIIDFMNQDASEILDSTDPIYPATREQEEESFFVRYANQRSITQFVPGSRSLESGNDFIGTCPYVFLVHLLAMHNEFLVRDYERQTEALTLDIDRFNQEARLSRAADRFYGFRTGDYTKYQKHKYANVFRYDTERDLFNAVEARRGTHRKDEYLNAIVTNLEAQTRDLEGRLRAKVDRQFSLLLAAVGIFSVLQVLYQVLDISTRGMDQHLAQADRHDRLRGRRHGPDHGQVSLSVDERIPHRDGPADAVGAAPVPDPPLKEWNGRAFARIRHYITVGSSDADRCRRQSALG